MKRLLTLLLLIGIYTCISATGFYNVKDFGAKGDGKNIDSHAINAAIEEQIRKDDFSIDALADAMCMSKANFYCKFKAITGTSPNEYMKTYRLNRAAEMIAEGARINEAAEAVGFDSSSYFAKCFKAKFGVLPNDYLKN